MILQNLQTLAKNLFIEVIPTIVIKANRGLNSLNKTKLLNSLFYFLE